MNKEKKEYIDGIFNYCNRWCEKCKFTSNCRTFSIESRIYTHEILNDGQLPEAKDIIKHELKEFENEIEEFDFDVEVDLDLTEEREEIFDLHPKEKKEYEIEKLADEYFRKVHSFLKIMDEKFNFTEADNQKKKEPKFQMLFENFEIISWYHMFIMVKIKRAIRGKSNLKIGMDEFENIIESYDMNGTAKIAAIGIKESQKALNNLLSFVKECSSEIEDKLVLLGKILNLLDKEFPDYKNFIRPGFDTEE